MPRATPCGGVRGGGTGRRADAAVHHLAMVFAGFKGRADLVRRLPPREAKGAKLELPLMIACEEGNEAFCHAECVRVLLRGGRRWGGEKEEGRRGGGADAEAALPSGHTSLMIARQTGHAGCVRAMLEERAGVDLSRRCAGPALCTSSASTRTSGRGRSSGAGRTCTPAWGRGPPLLWTLRA